MFVKNDFEIGFANGTLGIVRKLEGNAGGPVVEILRTGEFIEVPIASWTIEEEGKAKAELQQYPLRLAWAITVHKSQGMSLDAVEVDLSKSFEKGMGYVALSRVRTLAGLTILGMNESALEVNDEVLEHDEELKVQSETAVKQLKEYAKKGKLQSAQESYLASITSSKPKKAAKPSTFEVTHELIKEELLIEEIAKKRGITEQTVIDHIEKLVEEDAAVLREVEYLRKTIPKKRFDPISEALAMMYEKNKDWRLAPAKDYLEKNKKKFKLSPAVSYREVQLVRIFVKAEVEGDK